MSIVELLSHCTYDDYRQWDGDWESIEGIPVAMVPSPTKRHQRLTRELFLALHRTLPETCRCELLYGTNRKICNDTVVRPDIVLVCGDENDAYISKTPELIIKLGDFSDETLVFEDIYCDLSLNLASVFQHFR